MVLIAIPHTGDVKTELVRKLLELDKQDGVEILFSRGRPVDSNRCEIVEDFLDSVHNKLIMVDSDILPPENLLDLTKGEGKVVSATVFSVDESVPYPVAAVEGEDGKLNYFRGWKESTDEEDDLAEVDAVGTGCIYIHKDVFESLDKPFFEFEKDESGVTNLSEDFSFSKKVREAGYSIYLNTTVVAGHKVDVNLLKIMEILSLAFETDREKVNFVGVHR